MLLGVDTAVAVVGAGVLVDAVVRALVVQACSIAAPGELELIAVSPRDAWAERMPHRHVPATRALAVLDADDPRPRRADGVLVRVPADTPPPSWCGAVLTVSSPQRARLDHDGRASELRVECLSAVQAADVAADLARRALALGVRTEGAEAVVHLADLLPDAPEPAAGGLRAVLGRHDGSPFPVDLVPDGPHAVVAGVTGSGKSELLISWILSLCAQTSTAEVSFLLADFKGGTAFDALSGLPHVTGVLTDLDGGGARRAIDSLRAEVRWRERALADAGARDIRDPRVHIPRLVIVVDEFAALLGAHPELHAVFIDVAARGRALGMHLILGTQRVAGVVRESLLANCPLRVSLRVTDAADSRAVIGTDEAALLPGGRAGAGRALVRRAGDGAPLAVRIALAEPGDVERVAHASRGPAPRRPWLPDLPAVVPLASLLGQGGAGDIVLGIVDEPERQRQSPALLSAADRGMLVVGAAGSGTSTILDVVAAQARGSAVRVPADAEAAWDTVSGLADHPPGRGDVLLLDDLDALAGALPPSTPPPSSRRSSASSGRRAPAGTSWWPASGGCRDPSPGWRSSCRAELCWRCPRGRTISRQEATAPIMRPTPPPVADGSTGATCSSPSQTRRASARQPMRSGRSSTRSRTGPVCPGGSRGSPPRTRGSRRSGRPHSSPAGRLSRAGRWRAGGRPVSPSSPWRMSPPIPRQPSRR